MSETEAKNTILASIRRHLAASRPFDAVHQAHHASVSVNFGAAVSKEFSTEDLIEKFRTNFEAVGGKFTRVVDEPAAAQVLSGIIDANTAQKIAFTDSPLVKRIVSLLKNDAEFIENAAAGELFETDLGVTGAQWAISETGTLVLESARERNRLASLVPPVHVCLLETPKIRPTLGAVLSLLEKDLSRAVTFITGPSRTSDIELTLAIGVHGPGELYVILIDRNE